MTDRLYKGAPPPMPKAKRATIYMADAVAEFFADADSLSGRVAAVALRYREIARRELPALTRAQWCAVADANSGCDDLLADAPEMLSWMLWANVSNSAGLGERWEIDEDALVAEMRGWSYAQTVAAYEAVRTFWLLADQPTDDAMRRAGMIGR